MPQNLFSLDYTDAEIDKALAVLERQFAKLPEPAPEQWLRTDQDGRQVRCAARQLRC